MSEIPGYGFGLATVSPVSMEELWWLEETVGWTGADSEVLLRHAEFFTANAEAMVDSWRAKIGAQAHLAQWFVGPDGRPDEAYKARVRARFVQWVVDVAVKPHDRAWLDYQEEIGLRHTPAKKNLTDGGRTPEVVPLRYLLGFMAVVGEMEEFVEEAAVLRAWRKALSLHVALWARAYARDGLW